MSERPSPIVHGETDDDFTPEAVRATSQRYARWALTAMRTAEEMFGAERVLIDGNLTAGFMRQAGINDSQEVPSYGSGRTTREPFYEDLRPERSSTQDPHEGEDELTHAQGLVLDALELSFLPPDEIREVIANLRALNGPKFSEEYGIIGAELDGDCRAPLTPPPVEGVKRDDGHLNDGFKNDGDNAVFVFAPDVNAIGRRKTYVISRIPTYNNFARDELRQIARMHEHSGGLEEFERDAINTPGHPGIDTMIRPVPDYDAHRLVMRTLGGSLQGTELLDQLGHLSPRLRRMLRDEKTSPAVYSKELARALLSKLNEENQARRDNPKLQKERARTRVQNVFEAELNRYQQYVAAHDARSKGGDFKLPPRNTGYLTALITLEDAIVYAQLLERVGDKNTAEKTSRRILKQRKIQTYHLSELITGIQDAVW